MLTDAAVRQGKDVKDINYTKSDEYQSYYGAARRPVCTIRSFQGDATGSSTLSNFASSQSVL